MSRGQSLPKAFSFSLSLFSLSSCHFELTRSISYKRAQPDKKIHAVIADPAFPWTLRPALDKCGAVIECSSTEPNCTLAKGVLEETIKSGPNKLFVWTTGFLQYPFEKELMAVQGATVCVVRPAFTYGGKYGIAAVGPILFPAKGQPFYIGGNKNRKWSWVHMEGMGDVCCRCC